MGSGEIQKPHAVLLPHPSQGHINPMMRLAKLLHSRGFYITFVNTEFIQRRLIRCKGLESLKGFQDFRFETIPDGLPLSSAHNNDDVQEQDSAIRDDVSKLCDSTRRNCLVPFKQLLQKLKMMNNNTSNYYDENDEDDDVVPPVSCVISDGTMSCGIKAAKDLGIPQFHFWTASVCSFIAYLHYRELKKRGIVPFKNDEYLRDGTLNKTVEWICGMRNVKLRDLPSFVRTTDPNDIMFDFMGEEAHSCLKAPAIIFNTFDGFEQEAIDAVKENFNYPNNVYTIGPLSLLGRHFPTKGKKMVALNSSLWKPDPTVLVWLDTQVPNSVVYVNYGSNTTMTREHFIEFAWGLANSNLRFLWIVRPDVVKEEGSRHGGGTNTASLLPDEFLEEVRERGMVTSWCAQDQVLSHPAVGAFLCHCGWNSMTETVCAGVPVICWPYFADQQTNSHYSCEKWGIGMEMNHDVKRDEVSEIVCRMMYGEEGHEMRKKAREWKKMAEEATDVGGSSYINFDKLIVEALDFHG